ncbi:MAG TPA: ABATE domain-containing protein [Terriglobales bacterium]|jgi:predicted RNA-binding Zn ribbon-like protein|nr:ABATE domain-containing protein [Terriglobales bacterium]
MDFELIAGNLALDFANTIHNYGAPDPGDDLQSFADLTDWAQQAGLLPDGETRALRRGGQTHPEAAADFQRALQLRGLVYEVFSGIARRGKSGPLALAGLNEYFRRAMAQVSIARVGDRYELAWEKSGRIFDRVLWAVVRSAMELLTSDRLLRIRQCAGENCTWLFVDTSRNGMRRWCDMQACGNRAKVRRFRQRGRAAAGPGTSKLGRVPQTPHP